jgi:hypothetical protein
VLLARLKVRFLLAVFLKHALGLIVFCAHWCRLHFWLHFFWGDRFLRGRYWSRRIRVETSKTQLSLGGQLDHPQEVLANLRFDLFVAPVLEPNLKLIEVARGRVHKHASHLVSELKLLTNEAHQQILPDDVGVGSSSSKCPCAAHLVRRVLPLRLYSLDKYIEHSILLESIRPLYVLVDVPKLVNGLEIGHGLHCLVEISANLPRKNAECLLELSRFTIN